LLAFFPKKHEVWVVCENTPLGRVRSGDGPGWAGKILKNT
jgi:hypothetical protein